MEAGVPFESVFFQREIADQKFLERISKKMPDTAFYTLSRELFSKLSYRETTGGLIAVVKTEPKTLDSIKLPANPLVLIIEGVEKPGNLGAILRTADASAVDAVICCNLPSDIYNPNIVRASLGTVFTVPLAIADNASAMAWLKKNKITTWCTNLHKAEDYHTKDYTRPTAIVMGTEATGVTEAWVEFANGSIKIPMLGKIDSMNVSVATAIAVYEARRQRLLK